MLIKRVLFLVLGIVVLCVAVPARAQNAEETVRINTRVVVVNALVRDAKTHKPVTDLRPENFEVLDDGRPRTISYFASEGAARQPLALVLVMNLNTDAIRYLEKPEVMEQIIASLAALRPEDEVAVMQTWYEPLQGRYSFEMRSKLVEGLTRDRAKTFEALRSVQRFAHQNLPQVKMLFSMTSLLKAGLKAGLTAQSAQSPPPLIITTAPDYVNMVEHAPAFAAERPDSQTVIVDISDNLEADYRGRTTNLAKKLSAAGVTVNAIAVGRSFLGKMGNLFGHVLAPAMGMRFHTIEYFAEQTGGEVASADNPKKFAAAVSQMIEGLAARYSLGFTISDEEIAEGRVHTLEVRVKARDSRKRDRRLFVRARSNYSL